MLSKLILIAANCPIQLRFNDSLESLANGRMGNNPPLMSESEGQPSNDWRFSVYEDIEQLPKRFRASWEEASKDNFFSSPGWYKNFLRTTLQPEERCLIYVAERDKPEPGSIAILLTKWSTRKKVYGARRFMHGLTGPYSCEFGLLAFGDSIYREEASRRIAQVLLDDRKRLEAVRIDSLPEEREELEMFSRAFRAAGFLVQPFFHFGNWYEEVEGITYEEYLSGRSKQLQNTIRRKRKRLAASGNAQLRIFTGGDELSHGLSDYERVYAASWKAPEPYPEFIPGLIEVAARSRCLRLGVLSVAGEPVAAQIWLVSGGRATIYKLAYAETWRDMSAGTLLTAAMIERILAEGHVKEIDFGRGDDKYKSDWLSKRRERKGLIAFNPRTVRGMWGAVRHVGAFRVRRTWMDIAGSRWKRIRGARVGLHR